MIESKLLIAAFPVTVAIYRRQSSVTDCCVHRRRRAARGRRLTEDTELYLTSKIVCRCDKSLIKGKLFKSQDVPSVFGFVFLLSKN